jgi:hypothetical protein
MRASLPLRRSNVRPVNRTIETQRQAAFASRTPLNCQRAGGGKKFL